MPHAHPHLTPDLTAFITRQKLFFVATAPLAAAGHLNLSPKGLDTFAVLDEHTVAYLDLTGSGVETIAHVRENGRIVIMFCALEGPPRILRLHGHGEVLDAGSPAFAALAPRFPDPAGARAIIRMQVRRVSTSCGFGVPRWQFVGDRADMTDWLAKKGPAGLRAYRAKNNTHSIDGLPGLPPPTAETSPRQGKTDQA